jgi:cell division transport system permease protein
LKGLFNATSTACKNLWIEKWINILTVITLSACIMIAGICIIIPVNVHALIKTWVKDFGIVIYLKEDITNSEQQAIITRLEKDTDFRDLVFVSKDEALKKLQNYFSESDDFSVESLGTDSNPLPQSIELKFSRDTITPSFVEDKVSLIKTFSGVDDIQYGTEWLVIMSRVFKNNKLMGFFIFFFLFWD